MKRTPANILRHFLVNAGIGTLPVAGTPTTWPIYTNSLPDTPDNSLMISDTVGMSDGRYMRTGQRVEHPGVQILIRNLDQTVGADKAGVISLFLAAIVRQIVVIGSDSYLIQNVSQRGTIIPLGGEREPRETAKKRFIWTLNAIMTVEMDSAAILLPYSIGSPSLIPFWHSQVPVGVIDGANRVFTITALPGTTETYMLYVEGKLQTRITDYNLVGTTITFLAGRQPLMGQTIQLVYIDQG